MFLCHHLTFAQFIPNEPAQSSRYFSLTYYSTDGSPESIPGQYAEYPRDTSETQAPMTALFKSMLVPGWGQLGNRKYVKAGLIIGLESVLIGAIVHWADKTSVARELFNNEADTNLIPLRFQNFDDARDRRNFYSWLLATTVFISIFDAYVDAHLAKFPKPDKKLSFEVVPPGMDRTGAYISYRF